MIKYLTQLLESSIDTRSDVKGTNPSDRHLLTLFSIALATRGKVYLELGVREGATTLPLLMAAHLNNGLLISVDIEDTKFICPPELAQNWKFIKSGSLEFLKSWDPDKKIDFVFIDDCHKYNHVKQELVYFEKYTTPSSIITLHDLMYWRKEPRYHSNLPIWRGRFANGGPYRAVNKLNKRKWEWATLPWSNGLTILRKKAKIFRDNRFRLLLKRIFGIKDND